MPATTLGTPIKCLHSSVTVTERPQGQQLAFPHVSEAVTKRLQVPQLPTSQAHPEEKSALWYISGITQTNLPEVHTHARETSAPHYNTEYSGPTNNTTTKSDATYEPSDNVVFLIRENQEIDMAKWDSDTSPMSALPNTSSFSSCSVDIDSDYGSDLPRYFEYPSATESTNPDSSLDSFGIDDSFRDANTHTNNNNTDASAEDQDSVYIYDSCSYTTVHTNYTPTKQPELGNVPENMNTCHNSSSHQPRSMRTIPVQKQACHAYNKEPHNNKRYNLCIGDKVKQLSDK